MQSSFQSPEEQAGRDTHDVRSLTPAGTTGNELIFLASQIPLWRQLLQRLLNRAQSLW